MHRITTGRLTALITGVLIATALVAAPLSASAKDGDVMRTGDCTARSDWKLKLSPENGRIEVELEVDQNRNDQKWKVVLRRNGQVFWRGARLTQPPSGSFEVRKVANDGTGTDRIVARARDVRTGEVCRGVARF